MSLRINQNIDAFNSYRNLSVTQNQMSKSLEKLSSGFRINRAADDAAGLAISEGLRSQVNGYNIAARNAQDGMNVLQTAVKLAAADVKSVDDFAGLNQRLTLAGVTGARNFQLKQGDLAIGDELVASSISVSRVCARRAASARSKSAGTQIQ